MSSANKAAFAPIRFHEARCVLLWTRLYGNISILAVWDEFDQHIIDIGGTLANVTLVLRIFVNGIMIA